MLRVIYHIPILAKIWGFLFGVDHDVGVCKARTPRAN